MRRIAYLFALLASLTFGCQRSSDVIYEMDVRQFTAEGTFAAAVKELPRLKEQGVDILWMTDRRADEDSLKRFSRTARLSGFKIVLGWDYQGGFNHDVRMGNNLFAAMDRASRDSVKISAIRDFVAQAAAGEPSSEYSILYTIDPALGEESTGFGQLQDNMSMLTFTLPQGHPMIRSGQDSTYDYTSLAAARHDNPALMRGDVVILEDQWVPDGVLAFTRTYKKNEVLVMANFTDTYLTCALPEEMTWDDAVTGEALTDELICPLLEPWGWRILVRR